MICSRCYCEGQWDAPWLTCDKCRATRKRQQQRKRDSRREALAASRQAAGLPLGKLAPVESTSRDLPSAHPAADALMGAFGMVPVPAQDENPARETPVAPRADVVQPRNTGNSGNGLLLVVPDLHAPLHDPAAVGAVLSMMDSHKFDEVVFLGDEAELVSLSWFGGPDSLKKYKDEALEVRAVLQEFRKRHQGRMTSTVGNHTARIESAVERTKPQLAGSIKDEIGYDTLGIEVIPEDRVLVRGKIKFVHGHQSMGGRNIPIYHARVMADLYAVPGWSLCYGHTHRSQTFVRRMDEGNFTSYGLGCLEKRPRWLKGVCGWTQEVAVCHPSSGYVEPLRVIDGVLWYGGRRFCA